MNETVSNELRDSVMNEIVLADNQNHICFDCGSKEPKWASPYLGFLKTSKLWNSYLFRAFH